MNVLTSLSGLYDSNDEPLRLPVAQSPAAGRPLKSFVYPSGPTLAADAASTRKNNVTAPRRNRPVFILYVRWSPDYIRTCMTSAKVYFLPYCLRHNTADRVLRFLSVG